MSTTWEDVQAELAYDHFFQEVESQLEEQKTEIVSIFLCHGFEEYADVTSALYSEVQNASSQGPQSLGLLSCVLMEAIERETICLPLFVAGLGINEKESGRITKIKKMISRGVDSARFTYSFFEDGFDKTGEFEGKLKNHLLSHFAGHDFFKPENGIWAYREKVTSYRNHLVHGRRYSSEREAKYVWSFANLWKNTVYNEILNRYRLVLDDQWMLVDTK